MSDYDARRQQLRYELVMREGANLCEVLTRLAADIQQRKRDGWVNDNTPMIEPHGRLYTAYVFMEWYPDAPLDEFSGWTVTATGEVVT
jgi:hypothetical protein